MTSQNQRFNNEDQYLTVKNKPIKPQPSIEDKVRWAQQLPTRVQAYLVKVEKHQLTIIMTSAQTSRAQITNKPEL